MFCLDYADEMLIFAVLEQWLLQQRDNEASFVCLVSFKSRYKNRHFDRLID